MNELDALRLMVQHFPGGRPVVALRLNKSEEVLRKELSGTDAKFKMGLRDAMAISDMCIEAESEHCRAYVSSVAASSGGFVQLPVRDMAEPLCVRKTMGEVIREMSDVSMTTIEGDADDVISDNDLARNLKEINEAREALQKHEQALRAKNLAGKPAELRSVA